MPFFIAIALALILTWAARRVGLAAGLVDRPSPGGVGADGLKIHTVPIPVLGGLGVMAAMLATLLLVGAGLPAGRGRRRGPGHGHRAGRRRPAARGRRSGWWP